MSIVKIQEYLCNHPDALKNRKQMTGVIKDRFADNPAKATQLLSVLDLGIIEKITSRQLSDDPLSKGPMVSQVHRLTGYTRDIATWVVDTWLSFIDKKVLDAYEKSQKLNVPSESKQDIKAETKQQNTACIKDFSLIEVCQSSINNSAPLISRELYFPSGNSRADTGFYVRGVKTCEECEHPYAPIYAVILGFLQRKLHMTESMYLKSYFKKLHKDLDFSRVYRYEILLLVLIKNNYFVYDSENTTQKISLRYSPKDQEEIRAAIEDINHYAGLLSKLSHMPYKKLELTNERANSVFINIVSNDKDSNNDKRSGVYIEDLKGERIKTDRYLWCEPNIIFEIEEFDKETCEELLHDLLGFPAFRPGQFEAISAILNDNTHKVCVMPTGAGKSLIFYFVALLHSRPTFVVTPTDILIEDQIRNLKEYHEIDDATRITDMDNLLEFIPTNKLIYLTADTFLKRDLILRLIPLNHKKMIGNIVLDEVHCISNWSHDFRPEYLMLSYNLKEFVDKTGYLCFTATANYTVMKDIMYQLELSPEQILSFEPQTSCQRRYHFLGTDSPEELRKKSARFAAERIGSGNRVLCFTKTSHAAEALYEELPENIKDTTDCYLRGEKSGAYFEFSQGKVNGLIADQDIGIGVNLPNIQSTLHAGLPISKSQYVQEIGRAGRNGGTIDSYVVFQNRASIENRLFLRREAPTEDIFKALEDKSTNDLAETMHIVFDGVVNKSLFSATLEKLTQDFLTLSSCLCPGKKYAQIAVVIDKEKNLRVYMRCLYMLFRMGILQNWYIIDISSHCRAEFFIKISEPNDMLNYAKERLIEYLRAMGDFGRIIRQIKTASSFDEIRRCYVDWYYDHFLYHHREQVLEMHEFLQHFQTASDDEISTSLKNYFSLSLFSVKETGDFIKALTIKDISNYANSEAVGLSEDVSRNLENEYHYKLDYYLFCYNATHFDSVDASRLSRAAANCSPEERFDILTSLQPKYEASSWKTRLEILDIMCRYFSLEEVTNHLYAQNDDAMVLLTVLCFNQKWGGSYA